VQSDFDLFASRSVSGLLQWNHAWYGECLSTRVCWMATVGKSIALLASSSQLPFTRERCQSHHTSSEVHLSVVLGKAYVIQVTLCMGWNTQISLLRNPTLRAFKITFTGILLIQRVTLPVTIIDICSLFVNQKRHFLKCPHWFARNIFLQPQEQTTVAAEDDIFGCRVNSEEIWCWGRVPP